MNAGQSVMSIGIGRNKPRPVIPNEVEPSATESTDPVELP